jgi:hypothetical protein
MTTSVEQQAKQESDFMAAKKIKAILSGREKPEQERIVRWVSESLGIGVLGSGTSPQAQHAPPAQASTSSHVQAHPGLGSGRPKDIKVFVEEKQPKSDMQFAAVVAYFHRFEVPQANQKEAITSEDLQDAARLSGRSRFRSPTVPLNNAVNQGYLDRAGRGTYRVSAVGENLVAMTLPGTGGEAHKSRPSRKRKLAKKENTQTKRS